MVHRKSTYKLMFKNYNSTTRRTVWQENVDLRERRKSQEQAHQSIRESDSDCDCDDEVDQLLYDQDEYDSCSANHSFSLNRNKKDVNIKYNPNHLNESLNDPPPIPRLQFSPDVTPRKLSHEILDESQNLKYGSNLELEGNDESEVSNREDVKLQLSKHDDSDVIKNVCSKYKEYDILPATVLKEDTRDLNTKSPKKIKGILRSKKYPMTTKLSKTTMKSIYDQNKSPPFVSYGAAGSVRNIGDKTSYNVCLGENQVHKTALTAKQKRQQEIDNLVKAQRKISLEDWRKKTNMPENVNHSSLFSSSSRRRIYSKTSCPRTRTGSAPGRVQFISDYCKHCGGRK